MIMTPGREPMMNPGERLIRRQKEIQDILALYGAKAVRIWGVPDTDSGLQTEVDVLLSFDETDFVINDN